VLPVNPETGSVTGEEEVICPLCYTTSADEGTKVDIQSTSEALSVFHSSLAADESHADSGDSDNEVRDVTPTPITAAVTRERPSRTRAPPARLSEEAVPLAGKRTDKRKAALPKKASQTVEPVEKRRRTQNNHGRGRGGRGRGGRGRGGRGRGGRGRGGRGRGGRGRGRCGVARGGRARKVPVIADMHDPESDIDSESEMAVSPQADSTDFNESEIDSPVLQPTVATSFATGLQSAMSFVRSPVLDPNLAFSQLLAFQTATLSAERLAMNTVATQERLHLASAADRQERMQMSSREHSADKASADGHKSAERINSSQQFQLMFQSLENHTSREQNNYQLQFAQQTATHGLAVTAAVAADRAYQVANDDYDDYAPQSNDE
jgi:hypothetical protein